MIELAFVVCLGPCPTCARSAASPTFPMSALMGCMMQAQPQLAEWSETHPNHTIARWTCQTTDSREIKA